jgi:hypothetical protein
MRHSRRFYIRLGAGLGVLLLLLVVWQAVIQADPGDAPILLVVNDGYSSNHFGRYLGEILRAEGLNSFDVMDISSLDAAELTGHDLTILAETSLTSAQAAMLNTYVSGGGRLLAMRPDEQIQGLFGLGASAGVLSNGYVQIDTAALLNGVAPGQGLTSATLQLHGDADEYSTLAGAVSLAQLYSNASTPTSYPAVVGDGTGRAVAFTYDLARNVIYTRQGNPANANLDVDNDGVTRTVDLFMPNGGAPWVDRDKIPLPQADVQQRLFARLGAPAAPVVVLPRHGQDDVDSDRGCARQPNQLLPGGDRQPQCLQRQDHHLLCFWGGTARCHRSGVARPGARVWHPPLCLPTLRTQPGRGLL